MKVGIIGRSNVGKSTLFNALIRSRHAITSKHKNTTRDLISAKLNIEEKEITLYDLPGWETLRKQPDQHALLGKIALFLLVVDGQEGMTQQDKDVYTWLKKTGKNFTLIVNKIDTPKHEHMRHDFAPLQAEQTFTTSAAHKINIDHVRNYISGFTDTPTGEKAYLTIAITGKQNAGKSTLLNSLCGFTRSTVSEERGTTRDYVEEAINFHKKKVNIIDTAGYFRGRNIRTIIDIAVQKKIIEALERSDVIIFLTDITSRVSKYERKLASIIKELNKPCIICINKTDLVRKEEISGKIKDITTGLRFLNHYPFMSASALMGKNLDRILSKTIELYNKARKGEDSGRIKQLLSEITTKVPPPIIGTRAGKIRKISLKRPSTIILEVDNKKLFPEPYLRRIHNEVRKHGYFNELPLKVLAINESKEKVEQARRRTLQHS